VKSSVHIPFAQPVTNPDPTRSPSKLYQDETSGGSPTALTNAMDLLINSATFRRASGWDFSHIAAETSAGVTTEGRHLRTFFDGPPISVTPALLTGPMLWWANWPLTVEVDSPGALVGLRFVPAGTANLSPTTTYLAQQSQVFPPGIWPATFHIAHLFGTDGGENTPNWRIALHIQSLGPGPTSVATRSWNESPFRSYLIKMSAEDAWPFRKTQAGA
jgi:hypothetical protein